MLGWREMGDSIAFGDSSTWLEFSTHGCFWNSRDLKCDDCFKADNGKGVGSCCSLDCVCRPEDVAKVSGSGTMQGVSEGFVVVPSVALSTEIDSSG